MRSTVVICLVLFLATLTSAQSGGHVLIGDIKVDDSNADGAKALSFQVLLYAESGGLLMRQTVTSNGRYRFLDLRNGRYEVVVEFENQEIARVSVSINSPYKTDFRKDIELQWKSHPAPLPKGVITPADYYDRSPSNKVLFRRAKDANSKKQYERAIDALRQLVEADDNDFVAWEELGTNYFILKSFFEAESCYVKSVQLRRDYLPALINLGRVRIVVKNYDGAIEALDKALKVQPTSAQANYFLGEAYLQMKLGSKAVVYLNQALKLDPAGMAEAHMLLAALYDAKGLKAQAALEYTAFLKERPEYPDRRKLESYIAANSPKK